MNAGTEQPKAPSTLKKIGTFFIGLMILSFTKAAFHREPAAKQLSAEERQEQAKHMALQEFVMAGDARKATPEKRKYPRALPGGGVDWTGVEGGKR